jgi:hypothetical protein
MRKNLWPGLALLGLMVAALWVFVERPSVPDVMDDRWWSLIVLALLAGVALQAFRAGARDRHSEGTPASAVASGGQAGATTPPARTVLLVRGAAVATRCGHDPEAVLQALGPQPSMPEPDPDWLDDQGLPRLSARCSTLDVSRVTAALTASTSGAAAGRPGLVRALALQADALDGLQAAVQALPCRGGLDVHWTVPDHWNEEERRRAHDWLMDDLTARLPPDAGPVTIRLVGPAGLGSSLDRLCPRALGPDTPPCESRATLILACDSLIDPQQTASAALPGEAAAALLVETQLPDETSPQDGVLARLSWLGASSSEHPSERSLRDLAAQALDIACEAMVVGRVLSDVGLTGPEARQVLDATVELLPQLDVGERLCRIGLACGDLGCAGPLVALALGSHASHQDGAAALLLLTGRQPATALLTPMRPAATSPACAASH